MSTKWMPTDYILLKEPPKAGVDLQTLVNTLTECKVTIVEDPPAYPACSANEKLLFKELKDDPMNLTLRDALCDEMVERTGNLENARKDVTRIAMQAALLGRKRSSRALRRWLCRLTGAVRSDDRPLAHVKHVLLPGREFPQFVRHPGRFELGNGTMIEATLQTAIDETMYPITWHVPTAEVTVGIEWLDSYLRGERTDCHDPMSIP